MPTRKTQTLDEELTELIVELVDENTFRKSFLLDLLQQIMEPQKKKRSETCKDHNYLKIKEFYESMKNKGAR